MAGEGLGLDKSLNSGEILKIEPTEFSGVLDTAVSEKGM